MNIPRQFYGVNYISRLISNYQDTEKTYFPKMEYNYIDNKEHVALNKLSSLKLDINAGITYKFLNKLMEDKSCGVDGIAIARGEDVLLTCYRPPYSEAVPHITNSSCKTVTGIAVMFALSEDKLSLDDKVISFFPEYDGKLVPKRVREITVEHLLTMTSCSKTNELISVTEEDWCKAFIMTDCSENPGSRFIYNSINTYMLGAIVKKATGYCLMDYLTPRLFIPLGITDIKWELCPKGLERAGWGLHISLEGMLKVGMFLLNDGSFHGRQLIHPSFIRKMKNINVPQDTDNLSTGYGYQIWHLPSIKGRENRSGLYMLSGMYGQHVIIDENRHMIVAVNAHSDKMFPESKLTRSILSYIGMEELYVTDFAVKERINYRRLINMVNLYEKDTVLYEDAERIRSCIGKLDYKRLRIENGSIKLFPYLMQSMYMYPPYHVNEMAVKIVDEDTIKIGFYKAKTGNDKKNVSDNKAETDNSQYVTENTEKVQPKREHLDFNFGIGVFRHEMKEFGDDVRPVACKAHIAKDEDGRNVLMLDIVFPDTGYSRLIKLFFMEDSRLVLECVEYPDIKAIVDRVLSGETVLSGNTVDFKDKLPESIRVMLDHQMEPRMNVQVVKK